MSDCGHSINKIRIRIRLLSVDAEVPLRLGSGPSRFLWTLGNDSGCQQDQILQAPVCSRTERSSIQLYDR